MAGAMKALILKTSEIEQIDIDVNEIRTAYDEILKVQEEVGGGTVTYKAKIPGGGGRMFEITAGDPDDVTNVETFSGIIIHNHRANARFDEDTEGNSPPLCSSVDAKTGVEAETGTVCDCGECPYNEFGTAKNGRGKLCKNMHYLYILVSGVSIPIWMSVSPTSLKAWKNYRLSVLAAKGLQPHEVVTEFSVNPNNKSKGGQKYSTVKFKLVGKLSPEAVEAVKQIGKDYEPVKEITGDSYNRLEAASDE